MAWRIEVNWPQPGAATFAVEAVAQAPARPLADRAKVQCFTG